MRTNIVIDDALMAEAMRLSGLKTKKAVVEEALKLFVQIKRQSDILRLRGKVHWEGDLEESRQSRTFK
jgi:Arc/MetJ family transcription regulator